MSPTEGPAAGAGPGFPRVSGDEPATGKPTIAHIMFSPRERG